MHRDLFGRGCRLQPNVDTRAKQVEAWCDLVLAYCKATRTDTLDVTDAAASPLFCNAAIARRLPPPAIVAVLDELRARGWWAILAGGSGIVPRRSQAGRGQATSSGSMVARRAVWCYGARPRSGAPSSINGCAMGGAAVSD